jgi:hypothetical protein
MIGNSEIFFYIYKSNKVKLKKKIKKKITEVKNPTSPYISTIRWKLLMSLYFLKKLLKEDINCYILFMERSYRTWESSWYKEGHIKILWER